jgi:hypothetical protein
VAREDEIATAVRIPLTPDDVPALERLLRDSDPFVASTIDTDDPYRLVDYIQHSIYGESEIAAVLDRNLVSRIVSLAEGNRIDHSRPESAVDRVAAGCMAFLITAKSLTEPNVSLYELAQTADDVDGRTELTSFRIADRIHPQAYLEVALGRAPGIDPDLIDGALRLIEAESPSTETVDLEMPLRHWRRHRCALTQIALLERSSLKGRDKFRALLEWSVDPGFFDGLAIAFAIRLFGRAKPPGRLLKSVRSPVLRRCLAGVRSAAWDLTYISHWLQRSVADEPRMIWILCTNDRVLRDLARSAVGDEARAKALFTQNWRPREATELHQEYLAALEDAQSSGERLSGMLRRFEQVDALRKSIEERIQEEYAG